MGEFYGDFNIIVDDVSTWKMLSKADFSELFDKSKFLTDGEIEFISTNFVDEISKNKDNTYFCRAGFRNRSLEDFVKFLVNIFGEKCVIASQTQNIDVDPSKYCVYYFGEKVKTSWKDYYDLEDTFEGEDEFFYLKTEDIAFWVKTLKLKTSKNEKEHLKRFEIIK